MINLDEMKKQLNEDLQRDLEQEAREAGRMTDPEPIRTENAQDEPKKEKIEEKNIDDPIDLDLILKESPEDEKGNKIIPDDIFDKYYKHLPNGTKNQSGTWRAVNGGKLRIFGGDPEGDREIQKAGGEALQASLKHRRSMSEDIQIALMKQANPETIAALGLTQDANNQQAVIAAAILQAIAGNVKAQQFLRDTIGEQPTAKQDVSVTMTDADKKLLDQVQKRLGIDEEQG